MSKTLTGTSVFTVPATAVSPAFKAASGELRISIDTQTNCVKATVFKMYVDARGVVQPAPDSPKHQLSPEDLALLEAEYAAFVSKIWDVLKANKKVTF